MESMVFEDIEAPGLTMARRQLPGVTLRLALLCLVASAALAQTSPQELAQSVALKWKDGPRAAFEAIYPFQAGRDERQMGVREKFTRVQGLAEAIRSDAHHATLLISG